MDQACNVSQKTYSFEMILPKPTVYGRNEVIDEQVENWYQEDWRLLELHLSPPDRQSAVYTETLVDLYLIWMKSGRIQEAKKALKYIVKRVNKRVFFLCKTASFKEDLAQDVVFDIIKKLNSILLEKHSNSAHFLRINFKHAIDAKISKLLIKYIKNSQQFINSSDLDRVDESSQDHETIFEQTPDPQSSPEKIALLNITITQYLSKEQQEVVKLLQKGYTEKEIAVKIGRTDRTVRNILQRIRQILAQQ